MTEPYAAIHHFGANNNSDLRDVDGDPLLGWYYQIMNNEDDPATDLIGPYGSSEECEEAACNEWIELAA